MPKNELYLISRFHKTTVLIMDDRTRQLVASALEIVNPDDEKIEALARKMALQLQNL